MTVKLKVESNHSVDEPIIRPRTHSSFVYLLPHQFIKVRGSTSLVGRSAQVLPRPFNATLTTSQDGGTLYYASAPQLFIKDLLIISPLNLAKRSIIFSFLHLDQTWMVLIELVSSCLKVSQPHICVNPFCCRYDDRKYKRVRSLDKGAIIFSLSYFLYIL